MRVKQRRRLTATAFAGIGIVGALWMAGNLLAGQAQEENIPAPLPPGDTPFDLVIVQQGLDRRHITRCQAGDCQTLSPPPSEGADPVTDGTWWYHYQGGALRRTNVQTGDSELIIEQTPLVKPRDLYMSPDNKKVAFWLDNIDEPEEQLTELWVFDETAGGTRVVAEKVSRAGVLSSPRWNRASTHLSFLGQAGADSPQQVELLVVSIAPPRIQAGFAEIDWSKAGTLAVRGPMDVRADGAALVYAVPRTRRTSTLHILKSDGSRSAATVRGSVPYVQWLADGTVLYAGQQDIVTFWRLQDNRHQRLAESRGVVQSVRADPAGAYLAFAAEKGRQHVGIFTLDRASGTIAEHAALPSFGSSTYVVRAQPAASSEEAIPALNELDDAQLAKFIEDHLPAIAQSPAAQPRRLVITDKPNTVFLDYAAGPATLRRALVTVRDAFHDEWSVSARFEERSGEWVILEGGGTGSPTPKRLYEWEAGLKQWVLKEEY
jgi:hypothetical protein